MTDYPLQYLSALGRVQSSSRAIRAPEMMHIEWIIYLLCLTSYTGLVCGGCLCHSGSESYQKFTDCLKSQGATDLITKCLVSSEFEVMRQKVCSSANGEGKREAWKCLRSDSSLSPQVQLCKEQAYKENNTSGNSSTTEASMQRQHQFQGNGQPIAVGQESSTTRQASSSYLPSNSNGYTKEVHRSAVLHTSNSQINSGSMPIQNGHEGNGSQLTVVHGSRNGPAGPLGSSGSPGLQVGHASQASFG